MVSNANLHTYHLSSLIIVLGPVVIDPSPSRSQTSSYSQGFGYGQGLTHFEVSEIFKVSDT